jgi:hypothetical protein
VKKVHFLSIICTGRGWQSASMQFTDDPKKVTCLKCLPYVKNYLRNTAKSRMGAK